MQRTVRVLVGFTALAAVLAGCGDRVLDRSQAALWAPDNLRT